MKYWWASIFAFLGASCSNVDEEAGLTGSNRVVSVAYETGSHDPPSNIRLSITTGGKLQLLAESEYAGVVDRKRLVNPASFQTLAKSMRVLRVPAGTSDNKNCAEPVHEHALRMKLIWTYRDGREGSLLSVECTDAASVEFNEVVNNFKRELYDQRWLDALPEFYANALRPRT